MTIANPLIHKIAEFKLHAQSLRLWVLELLAWVAGWASEMRILRNDGNLRNAKKWLRDELAIVRRDIRDVLFLLVMANRAWRKKEKLPTTRPRNAAVGFRRVERKLNILKLYLRGIRLKTLEDMRTVLDDVDRYVARALKRFPRKGPAIFHIAPVAPPVWALICVAPAPAPDAADTS